MFTESIATSNTEPKSSATQVGEEDSADPLLSPACEVTTNDRERLLTLEKRLKKRIVGQDQAIEDVVNYILRTRAGLAEPNERTSGIFLFVGPSGCGKSLLAKRLFCELYDGDERDVVEIHLREYGERSSLSRLIGGSIENGHEEEGELIAPVLYKPNTVILLREVERAHPHILAVLLRLLNQGRFKTDQGQVVDFSKAMIIFTSAVGASSLLQIDSNTSKKRLAHQRTMAQIRAKFRSDFLTRLSEIVMFHSLDLSSLEEICFMALKNVRNLLASKGVCVALEKPAVRAIIADCYDQSSGAKAIDKYLEQTVVTTLSKLLIRGELTSGDTVQITVSDEVQNDLEPHGDRGKRQLRFQIEHGKTSAKNAILANDPSNAHAFKSSPEESDKSSDVLPVQNFNVLLSAVDSVASSKSSLKRKQSSPLNDRYETASSCSEKRRKDSFSQENQKNYLKSVKPETSRSESLLNPFLPCLGYTPGLGQKNKADNSVVSKSSTSISVTEEDVASEKHCDDRSKASFLSFAMENFPMFQENFGSQSSVSSVTSSMAEVWNILSPEERKKWELLSYQVNKKVKSQDQDKENSSSCVEKSEPESDLGSFDFSKPLHESPRDEHVNHPLLMQNERSGQLPFLLFGDYGKWLTNSNNMNYSSAMGSISHPFAHYPNLNKNANMAYCPEMWMKQMPAANTLNYLAPNRIDGPGAMDCEISTITNSIVAENSEKLPAPSAKKVSSSQSCRWCSAASNNADGVSLYCRHAFKLFCNFYRYQYKDPKAKEKKIDVFWKALSKKEHDFWIEKAKEEMSTSGASSPKATSVPKKPMSAFLYYSKEHRKSIMEKHTDLKFQNISKAVSNMWVNATDDEKAPFLQDAKKDRERYVREMEEWTNKWNALQEEREKVLNADREKENEE